VPCGGARRASYCAPAGILLYSAGERLRLARSGIGRDECLEAAPARSSSLRSQPDEGCGGDVHGKLVLYLESDFSVVVCVHKVTSRLRTYWTRTRCWMRFMQHNAGIVLHSSTY
jgi:hypothetical protein